MSLPKIKLMNQIISSLSVWLISAVYGLESGWSGPALKFLSSPNSPFLITSIDITWLAVISTTGNIVSICSCTIAAQCVGRKPLLSICCMVLVTGWALNYFADTLSLLMISKFFINFALGIFDVLNCIYISEVSSAKYRGILVSISMIFYTIGTECEFLIGFFQNYNLLSAVPLCVSILAVLSSCFVVESPYFLIMNGKNEEAYKNLSILDGSGSKESITRSYEELIQYAEQEKSCGLNFFKYLLLPQNYRIFICLLIVNSLVYINGFSVYTGYEPIIMNPFDVDHDVILNVLGITGLIATLCSPFVIKRFGRKKLMWVGFLFIGIVQILMAVCFYIEIDGENDVQYVPEILVFLATIGLMFFELTIYPVTHVLRAEMLPYKLKEKGTSVIVIFKAVIDGIVSATFFPLALAFGYGFNFILYSVAALLAVGYVGKFLIETKDKSLNEIGKCYA